MIDNTPTPVVVRQTAAELEKLLPNVAVDFESIAKALLDALEIKWLHHMKAREASLQKALSALMEYYNGLLTSAWERSESLEAKVHQLNLRIAKLVEVEVEHETT